MGKEAQNPRRLALGKAVGYTMSLLATLAVGFSVFYFAFPKRIAAATSVAGLELGLVHRAEARQRLEYWWDERKERHLVLVGADAESEPVYTTAAELGVSLDVEATLDQLPLDDVRSWFQRTSKSEPRQARNFSLVLDLTQLDVAALEQVVAQTSPQLAPAKAFLDDGGSVVRTPEVSSMALVRSESETALRRALETDGTCRLVSAYAEKDVPDDELAKITGVVSTFSTKFSASDRSRSKNLKIAAEKLDGLVLKPGERFSFNEFVGERSPENGFSKAGVYRQGRHEIDFGGGVCQVSTTLFNAVVLANLKVAERNNHTFLVPYVPVGRDAAVSFGTYDLAFVNTSETPIAIDTEYVPGKLTFSILGVPQPDIEVKILPVVTQTWTHDTVYEDDPTLAPGVEKEIEKGGKGYRAVTTKVVLKDGVEVSRETLCKSYYKGGPKIIARGPSKEKQALPATLPPLTMPPLTGGGL